MKPFIYLLFSLTLLFACDDVVEKRSETALVETGSTYVELIDFHSKHRCRTCNAIEDKSRTAVQTHFSEALSDGRLVFRTVNIDDRENQALAEAFEAYGTALYLHVVDGSTSRKIDLTDFAFMRVNEDGDLFETELVAQVREALASLN